MNRHSSAPMPVELRHMMRAGHHPARSTPCPRCKARAHQSCRLRKSGKELSQPHQQRIDAWTQIVACCPVCQVTPTIPCHANGRTLPGGSVHAERYAEAERTAA